MINLIWAQTKDRVIGKDDRLPWAIREEMMFFKETTLNQIVLMGSKTFKSMNEKPLLRRTNYVLTRNKEQFKDVDYDNLFFIEDYNSIVEKFANNKKEDIFVIGGNEIFKIFFPFANKVFRSIIRKEYEGNIYIDDFDFASFNLISKREKDEFDIEILERKLKMEKDIKKPTDTKKVETKKPTAKSSTKPKVETKPTKEVSSSGLFGFKKETPVESKIEKKNEVAKLQPNRAEDDKFKIDKVKMLYLWPSMLNVKRKSKKIVKKLARDPDSYSEQYRYEWVKKTVNKLVKAANVDIKVEGIENWLDRGVILAVNHQSNFDPAILFAINDFSKQQPIAFVAKAELWDHKLFGRFARLIDCVPLDRENPRSALEAFKVAKDLVVDYRRSLVIFPEGTRSGSNEMNEFHPASLKVAQMANAPIIPVTLINSYKVLKEDRPKRVEVKVVFGKPIMPAKHISLKTEDLTRNVAKEIKNNMEIWKDKEMKYELRKLSKKDIKEYKAELDAKEKEAKKGKKKKTFKDWLKIVD